MQVKLATNSDALARQKQRLRELAQQDSDKADSLRQEAAADQAKATEKQNQATENRQKGEDFKTESERLGNEGSAQSKSGLEDLANASDKYSESFASQETGLADLRSAIEEMKSASDNKGTALNQIDEGIAEQKQANTEQGIDTAKLANNNRQQSGLIQEKQASIGGLEENVSGRGEVLNNQTEKVADFLVAGSEFDSASQTKTDGVGKLKEGLQHRVQSEGLKDAQQQQELQQTWGEADASRHQDSEGKLEFQSMIQAMRSRAATISADFHRNSADKADASSAELSQQASELKAQASSYAQHARALQHSGQQKVACGRQMQQCPWTYCQGVHLEQQGLCELQHARQMKQEADQLKQQAQEKSLQAETKRVEAEQARAHSQDLEVKSQGHKVRSDMLQERSDWHQDKAEHAEQHAFESAEKAGKFQQASAQKMEQSEALRSEGQSLFASGIQEQKKALGTQNKALGEFDGSLGEEKELQSQAENGTNQIAGALVRGRSLLSRNGSLLRKLYASSEGEAISQEKISQGATDFEASLQESRGATNKADEAAQLLEQARELELEGLRLQNRGQRMLLEARPKMANAAKLSAQSFDAFKKADKQEEEAQRLIELGNEKLAAADIFKTKAEAYLEAVENA